MNLNNESLKPVPRDMLWEDLKHWGCKELHSTQDAPPGLALLLIRTALNAPIRRFAFVNPIDAETCAALQTANLFEVVEVKIDGRRLIHNELSGPDTDVDRASSSTLIREVVALRNAIRRHRDAEDYGQRDSQLYAVLPEAFKS
jgi:hypothetical protein